MAVRSCKPSRLLPTRNEVLVGESFTAPKSRRVGGSVALEVYTTMRSLQPPPSLHRAPVPGPLPGDRGRARRPHPRTEFATWRSTLCRPRSARYRSDGPGRATRRRPDSSPLALSPVGTRAPCREARRGQRTTDIAAYDHVHAQILKTADMLSTGIIHQFPGHYT